MNWQIVSAVCAAASVLAGALNAYQNLRIELRVERLRNELLVLEIAPLKERVSILESLVAAKGAA